MPRNGSGTYTLAQPAFANGTTADATAVNSDLSDIASALTFSIAKDGQTPPTANLPMGNFKLTGLTPGTASGDSMAYGTQAILGVSSMIVQAGAVDINYTASITAVVSSAFGFNNSGSTNAYGIATGNSYLACAQGFPLVLSTAAGTARITLATSGAVSTVGNITNAQTGAVDVGVGVVATTPGAALQLGFNNSGSTNAYGMPTGVNYLSCAQGFPLVFGTSAAERMRIAANGVVTVPGLLTATSGITFGGTTLANYDQGTTVPTVSGIGAPTYTTQTCEWQRVGNKVKFRMTLVWTGGSAAAITGIVTGLASPTATIQPITILVNLNNGGFTFTGVPVAWINGTATFQVGIQASATNVASLSNVAAGTKEIYLSGEYFV